MFFSTLFRFYKHCSECRPFCEKNGEKKKLKMPEKNIKIVALFEQRYDKNTTKQKIIM